MVRSLNPVARTPRPQAALDAIMYNIASSMVGRAVDLLVGADKTAHGIVSAVQFEAGTPKIVVEGAKYNLNQVLTAIPAAFN